MLAITLPIGISFYTFHALSYTIDVYRGTAPPVRSFIDFACYIALFPAARRRADHPLQHGGRPAREPLAHLGEVRLRA